MYAGLVFTILDAAGPTLKKLETDTLNTQNPIMIVLNLSSDMLQTDIKPNRLERAKIEIGQLLEQLKSSESGLIVYTQEPFLISPLSDDYKLVLNLLDAVNTDIMPVNGDRLDRAISLAAKSIKDAGYAQGTIFVYTSDAGLNFTASVEEAKKAFNDGYIVNIVNMSMSKNNKLEQIAKISNWNLFDTTDTIVSIADTILNY